MNRKHRLGWISALTVALLALPLVTVWADCPGPRIYAGGPVTDNTAARGSMANPATNLSEAHDICQACANGAQLHNYNTGQKKYYIAGSCVPEKVEQTGVPLAQSVATALLGLLAVGLLAWGVHLRIQLKRFQAGS